MKRSIAAPAMNLVNLAVKLVMVEEGRRIGYVLSRDDYEGSEHNKLKYLISDIREIVEDIEERLEGE